MKKVTKRFQQMTARELAKATKEFEAEGVADSFHEPGTEQKARWRRAKRKRGRPKVGSGAKVISLSIERGLLRKADALARKRGLSRSQLVAECLSRAVRRAGG